MQSIMGFMQKLGKTFMLPVALLAAMGIMLGIGSAFTGSQVIKDFPFLGNPLVQLVFNFMATVGSFAFANLAVMFAMAIPAGMCRYEKGVAGFAGFVGYVVMNMSVNFYLNAAAIVAEPKLMKTMGQAMVMGLQTIDTGILGGIAVGIIVYRLHERFYNVKLPDAFAFFGGARFVPIVSAFVMSIIGLLVPLVWPVFNFLIFGIGTLITSAGVFGPFLFGAGERLLIPFGLHHILVAMIRFTPAGGSMIVGNEQVFGALNIFYKQLADPATRDFSWQATQFLSQGKMPTFLFGLPAAALAMYRSARFENKPVVKGLFISGVIACVVGGITEPLEFLFLFVAPALYLFHAIMTGLGFMVMGLLHVTIGNTDGNIIDFLVFGVLQGARTKWYLVPVVGVIWFAVYYFVFSWAINRFDLQTPGREEVTEETANAMPQASLKDYNAEKVLAALGGKDNIASLENCITRLRLTLKNGTVVDEKTLKSCGALAVIRLSEHNIQVVIGPQVHLLKTQLDRLMGN